MPANPGLQVSLDVKGRSCLVLGGDDEAAEKVQRLLEAGAKVTVISPSLNDALRKLTASAKILHRGRLFREADADGVVLVINTLRGNPDFSKSLYELAKQERFLLCSTDQPEASTVMMPALVTRGHLRLAISTSGVSPALASLLRQEFGRVFDDEFASFLEWVAAVRDETKATETDAEQRLAMLRDTVNGFKITGKVEYPKAWLDQRKNT